MIHHRFPRISGSKMAKSVTAKSFLRAVTLVTATIFVFSIVSFVTATGPGETISGIVTDHLGPVAGAHIRIRGGKGVTTDREGRFALTGQPVAKPFTISAWKEGYYSALIHDIKAPREGLRIKLIRYQTTDNPAYEWMSPEGENSCFKCHPELTEMSLRDPHMKAARNPRFLTMYEGTDMAGNRSPQTRYRKGSHSWNNTILPQLPDLTKPYYGPGYLLDFPGTTGNCSSCHVPGASIPNDVDPRTAQGANRYGVHCDFCHKVADVNLNGRTKMPHKNITGVHAMDVRRPFPDDPKRPKLFFGSFEDAPPADTYLPLVTESRFCAPCHFGIFWDTVVYNSYGEWLESPYSDPKSGKAKTCQDCHMKAPTIFKGKTITNIASSDKRGIERDPATIHSHDMTVGEELLRNALSMETKAMLRDGRIEVTVTLENDKTGHHVPSDSPLRHLILIIEAKDSKGTVLKQLSGPKLPDWCGTRKERQGHYAGRPGRTYAKLLKEKWTEAFPTGAYWNHTELVSDNRLAAFDRDASIYAFEPPRQGKTTVTVKLLYRRAFIDLMERKKWDVPDILMARHILDVSRNP